MTWPPPPGTMLEALDNWEIGGPPIFKGDPILVLTTKTAGNEGWFCIADVMTPRGQRVIHFTQDDVKEI